MAQYHCHFDVFTRGGGRSAVAGAAYRSGQKITNEYDGVTHDYSQRNAVSAAAYRSGGELTAEQGETHDFSNKKGVVYSKIMLPDNAPLEYLDQGVLWNAIEKKDKRRDAQLARVCDMSLPVELKLEEWVEMSKEFADGYFVSNGICADINIHDEGDGNPHVHMQFTMRYVDKDGFGKRRAEEQGSGYFNKEQRLKEWRKAWADITNKHLEKHGFDERIDHRTLEAQGIDREPIKYKGKNYRGNKEARKKAETKQNTHKRGSKNKVETAESRRINEYVVRLEKGKADLMERDQKIGDLHELRDSKKNNPTLAEKLSLKKPDFSGIDKQISQLEKAQEYEMSLIQREIQQMRRLPVRENLSRSTELRETSQPQEGIVGIEKEIANLKQKEQELQSIRSDKRPIRTNHERPDRDMMSRTEQERPIRDRPSRDLNRQNEKTRGRGG